MLTVSIVALALAVVGALAFLGYCACVDGARRREYQDRVIEEWLKARRP